MLDWATLFFLKFGHITFILPAVVLGMLFHKRDLYAKAVCFLFFVIIFNTLLKHIFKVPLFPHLGDGYAFPSGHMHAATVFYGYIIYKIENKAVRTMLVFLLMIMGFSLIHRHFHDLFDVLGAVGFGASEIIIYHFLWQRFGSKCVAAVALIGSIAIIVTLSIIYKVEYHVWLAFYGLCGTIFSLSAIDDLKPKRISQKILVLFIIGLLTFFVYVVFRTINFSQPYLSEIKFMLLPIIIMGSINIFANFKVKLFRP